MQLSTILLALASSPVLAGETINQEPFLMKNCDYITNTEHGDKGIKWASYEKNPQNVYEASSKLITNCKVLGMSEPKCSVIDMNLCYGYQDLVVVPQENGNYKRSCHSINFFTDGNETLSCEGEQGTQSVRFENNLMVTDKGNLVCFGQESKACDDQAWKATHGED
ncbi:uncharacterized protein BCR38DRAFT_527172 [Pseudomassariella vexata]|uniref:Cyanovirin-N domain-containing protein n=1 Tax=Pseudomassariella vexata TaxID=1141098 RepID=A0A1Y2DIY4_9PEZI|nr:uncharacterized protein BCR38DRAFT_527172 [Pseudomassariella vexata]ORY59208.1 hypothetical protein BCR38DRAFT_527172 [Pseudomassariella vexata]